MRSFTNYSHPNLLDFTYGVVPCLTDDLARKLIYNHRPYVLVRLNSRFEAFVNRTESSNRIQGALWVG